MQYPLCKDDKNQLLHVKDNKRHLLTLKNLYYLINAYRSLPVGNKSTVVNPFPPSEYAPSA